MANKFTTFFSAQVLNTFRATNITAPANVYLAMFTSAPSDAGGGTEVTGGSYARQPITFGAPNGAVPNSMTNSVAVNFPSATANWGTLTHFAIMDAVTGGNMLVTDALTASKTIDNTDTLSVAIGNITITLD